MSPNVNQRISVLFLVMEFPPVNTTGNFRSLKFIKYLSQFDIDPIIITFKEKEASSFYNARTDYSLLDDLPKNTVIYRIHCEDGKKYYNTRLKSFLTIYFSIQDNLAKRWKKFLFKELDAIVKAHNPKVIFTSLPPFSSGMLAVSVAKKFQLPLVVDMRDFWAMWGNTPFGSKVHYWLTLREEEKLFKNADAVIGVTPQLIRTFQLSHPRIDPDKFHYISNGFDKNVELKGEFFFPPKKEKVVIGYVGSFYYHPERRANIFKPWWKKKGHKVFQYSPLKEDWLYRSPYFFFKTIARLFEKYPKLREVIRLEFVGYKPDWFDGMVKDFGLLNHVKSYGFVSHAEAIKIQQDFDLVLATSEKVIGGEHYCLPSKIFDYVGLNKPILGFVTRGIQEEFIKQSGLGIICDPDNIDESTNSLIDLLNNGKEFLPNRSYVMEFSRKKLSVKLASLFKTILDGK